MRKFNTVSLTIFPVRLCQADESRKFNMLAACAASRRLAHAPISAAKCKRQVWFPPNYPPSSPSPPFTFGGRQLSWLAAVKGGWATALLARPLTPAVPFTSGSEENGCDGGFYRRRRRGSDSLHIAMHNEALYDIPQARTQQRMWPSGRMLSGRRHRLRQLHSL